MSTINYILPYVNNIDNSPNELLNRQTLNRNFRKLLSNDLALNELYDNVYINNFEILRYSDGSSYNKGQLVWFLDDNMYGKKTLYLLESLFDNNTTRPILSQVDNNIYNFEASGWKDKNEYCTLYENNLSIYARQDFVAQLNTLHEFDNTYHQFGKLTATKSENDTKLMLKNASNVDASRSKMFFPNITMPLEADDTIMNGTCRLWDNGLVEYDIVYRLSFVKSERHDGADYDIISCNTFQPNMDIVENSKYFSDEDSVYIFLNKDEDKQKSITLEKMVQKNRNDYVNTYSGTLKFPIEFKDLNYMVFQSDVRCQERNSSQQTIDASSNATTYANKTTSSIDVLYLMFPENSNVNARKNGLVSNSFHCHIIGRWK